MGELRRVGRFKKSINQKCFEGGEAAFCVMNGAVISRLRLSYNVTTLGDWSLSPSLTPHRLAKKK